MNDEKYREAYWRLVKRREAYCVKCREKYFMIDCEVITMRNGRKAVKGQCTKCDTTMYSILLMKEQKELDEAT